MGMERKEKEGKVINGSGRNENRMDGKEKE